MKLLFDQNLSYKLCSRLADLFPDSSQARLQGLDQADDRVLWEYAKNNGYLLVTQDSDFAEMVALYGPPPKVIWLRCGNQPTAVIERLLRTHAATLESFASNDTAACLELR